MIVGRSSGTTDNDALLRTDVVVVVVIIIGGGWNVTTISCRSLLLLSMTRFGHDGNNDNNDDDIDPNRLVFISTRERIIPDIVDATFVGQAVAVCCRCCRWSLLVAYLNLVLNLSGSLVKEGDFLLFYEIRRYNE
jgi:hypothetical protein